MCPKIQKRFLSLPEKEKIVYLQIGIRLASGFSWTIMDVWSQWSETIKLLKKNSPKLKSIYPVKISIKYENKVSKNSGNLALVLPLWDIAWGWLKQMKNKQKRGKCDFKKKKCIKVQAISRTGREMTEKICFSCQQERHINKSNCKVQKIIFRTKQKYMFK